MVPMMLQVFSMLNVTVIRLRDFLVLPELKEETKQSPSDLNDAIVVEKGVFKWGCEKL
jgi:hypothetical protein